MSFSVMCGGSLSEPDLADKLLARFSLKARSIWSGRTAQLARQLPRGRDGTFAGWRDAPHARMGEHRMPIPGLYQTGATTFPGGSVTGAPGRNAATVMLKISAQASRKW